MRTRWKAALAPAVMAAADIEGLEALRAQQARMKAPARTGRGGGGRGSCDPGSVQDERFDQVWAGGAGSFHWGC